MTDAIGKFNAILQEFLDDLIKVFPEDPELRMASLATRGLSLASPATLHDGFRERVVVPYGDRILAKDISFFLEEADYSALTTELTDAGRIVDKVKRMFKNMTENDQAVVWKYMRMLVLLSRKIAA